LTTKIKLIALFSLGVISVSIFLGYRLKMVETAWGKANADLKVVMALQHAEALKIKIYEHFVSGDRDSLLFYCENYQELTDEKADFCGPLVNVLVSRERQTEDLNLTKEELQLQARNLRVKIDSLESAIQIKNALVFTNQMQMDSLRWLLTKQNEAVIELRASLEVPDFDTTSFVVSTGYRVRYTGQIAKNKANGIGTGTWPTGGYYHGEWKNNLRHGQGLYIWKEGHRYQGTFQNDARNGQGTYWWTNGERYEGNWKNNTRDGYGTLYAVDGSIKYQGQWVDDKPIAKK